MGKRYLDLKGEVGRTPYGIRVSVFINDELLERMEVKRKEFAAQKSTVDAAKDAEAKRRGWEDPS